MTQLEKETLAFKISNHFRQFYRF